MRFMITLNPLPKGGYYIARSEHPTRKNYSSYATVLLPCRDKNTTTSSRSVRKEDIMSLLRGMKTDLNKWFYRIIPALHQRLKKIVPNYSACLMEKVLENDKNGSVFDHYRVDLQKVFVIIHSISENDQINEDKLWAPVPIKRSNSFAHPIPIPKRSQSPVNFTDYEDDIDSTLPSLPDLSGIRDRNSTLPPLPILGK